VVACYTQSLAIEAPYPYFALAGTSTLLTYRAATTHFLYSWWIAMAFPSHCAPIEYNHVSFGTRVNRAIASQSGRVTYATEHGESEMRSQASQVLRATLKQTLVHPPGLNGRPAASRVLTTAWRECLAGIVIIPAGTSKRAKLRPRATVNQQARLLLPWLMSLVWRSGSSDERL
jgi:hypothetical protein